jgi:hypothetical protein
MNALPIAMRLLHIAVFMLLAHGRIIEKRISATVDVVLTATALEHRTSDDAALAIVWAGHESGGDPNATSPDGLDHGLMQLRGPALQGHTPAEVKADPVLCVRLWFRWLDVARALCKSTDVAALGALSTGKCWGAKARVTRRCMFAGVDCTIARWSTLEL